MKKVILALSLIGVTYLIYLLMPPLKPSEIIQEPDSRLNIVSEPVTIFDQKTEDIAFELKQILNKVDKKFGIFGLAMAAPQLGYNQRIVAVKESYGNYEVMVNPEIVEAKWKLPWIEKCFSVDGFHLISRYNFTKVRYQDLSGNYHEERAPKVLQQEIDHLNGVLISEIKL